VVSVNAWCGVMWEPLAGWVPGCGADVLCVQEVTRTAGIRGWANFEDCERTLIVRSSLFDDLRELLPEHQPLFVANSIGPITAGGTAHRQEFGIAMFVHNRLAIVGQHAAFVHRSFEDCETWPAGGPRAAHAVRVYEPRPARTTLVAHLHGLRDPAGKHDTPERSDQAERLAAMVSGMRNASDTVVVCGDLNLLPGSETFARLASAGLVDLVGDADTRTSATPSRSVTPATCWSHTLPRCTASRSWPIPKSPTTEPWPPISGERPPVPPEALPVARPLRRTGRTLLGSTSNAGCARASCVAQLGTQPNGAAVERAACETLVRIVAAALPGFGAEPRQVPAPPARCGRCGPPVESRTIGS
jgi:hypothetical protein